VSGACCRVFLVLKNTTFVEIRDCIFIFKSSSTGGTVEAVKVCLGAVIMPNNGYLLINLHSVEQNKGEEEIRHYEIV